MRLVLLSLLSSGCFCYSKPMDSSYISVLPLSGCSSVSRLSKLNSELTELKEAVADVLGSDSNNGHISRSRMLIHCILDPSVETLGTNKNKGLAALIMAGRKREHCSCHLYLLQGKMSHVKHENSIARTETLLGNSSQVTSYTSYLSWCTTTLSHALDQVKVWIWSFVYIKIVIYVVQVLDCIRRSFIPFIVEDLSSHRAWCSQSSRSKMKSHYKHGSTTDPCYRHSPSSSSSVSLTPSTDCSYHDHASLPSESETEMSQLERYFPGTGSVVEELVNKYESGITGNFVSYEVQGARNGLGEIYHDRMARFLFTRSCADSIQNSYCFYDPIFRVSQATTIAMSDGWLRIQSLPNMYTSRW